MYNDCKAGKHIKGMSNFHNYITPVFIVLLFRLNLINMCQCISIEEFIIHSLYQQPSDECDTRKASLKDTLFIGVQQEKSTTRALGPCFELFFSLDVIYRIVSLYNTPIKYTVGDNFSLLESMLRILSHAKQIQLMQSL